MGRHFVFGRSWNEIQLGLQKREGELKFIAWLLNKRTTGTLFGDVVRETLETPGRRGASTGPLLRTTGTVSLSTESTEFR